MYSVYKKRNFKVVDYDSEISFTEIENTLDNIKLQLEWIKKLQEQVDFANKEVLSDFFILFKYELRRPPPL